MTYEASTVDARVMRSSSVIRIQRDLRGSGIPARISRMVGNQVNKDLLHGPGMFCSKTIADGVALRPDCGVGKPIRTNAGTIEVRRRVGRMLGSGDRALTPAAIFRAKSAWRRAFKESVTGYINGRVPGSRSRSRNRAGLAD